jgi:signal transduction histidine kinase
MTITLDQRDLDPVLAGRTSTAGAHAAAGVIAVTSSLLAIAAVVLWAVYDPAWDLDTWFFGVDVVVAIVYAAASWVILSRRDHVVGWLFALASIGGALAAFGLVYTRASLEHPDLPLQSWIASAVGWGWVPGTLALVVVVPWHVRDGRLPRHAVIGAAAGWAVVIAILVARVTDPFPWPEGEPFMPLPIRSVGWSRFVEDAIPWLFGAIVILGIWAAADVTWRWRRGPQEQRRGLGWLAVGAAVMAVSFLPLVFPDFWYGGAVAVDWYTPALHVFAQAFLPAAALVAILRQQMWSIDLAVSRTLVWSLLTGGLITLYLALVAVAGYVLPSDGAAAAVAGGGVAIIIGPSRAWLQRRVDHLVHGESDRGRTVRRLGRQLVSDTVGDELLLSMLEGLVASVRLGSAAVDVVDPSGLRRRRAIAGQPVGDEQQVPLIVGATTIGWLAVTAPPGLRLDSRATSVIQSAAPVIASGVALADLTEEVTRSRERLRVARMEERRVLRREIHDGLGPALAGIGLGLTAYRNLRETDPQRADELLEALAAEVEQRAADVRTLSRALLPPVLEELGLEAAVRELVARYDSATMSVRLHSTLTRELPPHIAAAGYAIVSEALVNAHRHADATEVLVHLGEGPALSIDVTDNGRGVPPAHQPGVGMRSMRERAAELGGTCTIRPGSRAGTVVAARIPIGPGR